MPRIHTYFILLLLVSVHFLSACRKETVTTDPNAKLNFSQDTVLFDTVFTTVGSTTKEFKIYNRNNRKVIISDIRLAGGSSSPFRINVDGISTDHITDIELEGGDSLYIFVEVTLEVNNLTNPLVIEDSVEFITNGNHQAVKLVVWGQDAYFHVNELVEGAWLNDKPHVIYGIAAVGFPGEDSLKTLTIPGGTDIYLHNNSFLYVYKSTLDIQGSLGSEVTLQGDRLESYYADIPGQYRGIWLSQPIDCHINYIEMKNGSISLQVDTLGPGATESLFIENSKINNSSSASIYAVAGAKVRAENCVFGSAGQYSGLCYAGGDYTFTHCSFANYYTNSSRTTPAFQLNNWFEGTGGINYVRPLTINMHNCIIYGLNDEEVAFDTLSGAPLTVYMNHCLVKSELSYPNSSPNFNNIIVNNDPSFTDYLMWDFSLNSGSPAKGSGDPFNSLPLDILGTSRGNPPTIGAYE